jgi:hypothetical protein
MLVCAALLCPASKKHAAYIQHWMGCGERARVQRPQDLQSRRRDSARRTRRNTHESTTRFSSASGERELPA